MIAYDHRNMLPPYRTHAMMGHPTYIVPCTLWLCLEGGRALRNRRPFNGWFTMKLFHAHFHILTSGMNPDSDSSCNWTAPVVADGRGVPSNPEATALACRVML